MRFPVWSLYYQGTVLLFALWHDCHISGGGTELTFSADTMFESASAAAAGSAQRPGDVAPVTPERTVLDDDIEEDISRVERK